MISFYYAQGWVPVQATELAQRSTFSNYFFLYLLNGGERTETLFIELHWQISDLWQAIIQNMQRVFME